MSIEGVLGALVDRHPQLPAVIVRSTHRDSGTMIRIVLTPRHWYDLALTGSVWSAYSGEAESGEESGGIPLAVVTEPEGKVANRFASFLVECAEDDVLLRGALSVLGPRNPAAVRVRSQIAVVERPARVPGLLAAALLLLALLPLEYGFYVFLRLAVTALAVWVAVAAHKADMLGWVLFGLVMAILFNPLIPVYATRGFWLPIDLAGAAAFICAAFLVRIRA